MKLKWKKFREIEWRESWCEFWRDWWRLEKDFINLALRKSAWEWLGKTTLAMSVPFVLQIFLSSHLFPFDPEAQQIALNIAKVSTPLSAALIGLCSVLFWMPNNTE